MSRTPGTAPDALAVALNRERLNGVTAPDQFTATGDFRVELTNDDSPVHVHLRFDDALGRVAETTGSNHYLDPGARLVVDVPVADLSEPVEGALTVVTGHGSVEETVAVTIDPDDGTTGRTDRAVAGSAGESVVGSDTGGSGGATTGGGVAASAGRGNGTASPGGASAAASGGGGGSGSGRGGGGSGATPTAVVESVRTAVADGSSPATGTLLVGGFAAAVVVLALALAVWVDSVVVLGGAFAVVVAVAAAGYILAAG
ncbi:hypothetical protein RYH80_13505 [Halobaculum sp. MBLA0147]|uniref:DUF7524 family protein n=1 Tax=Halobaculum sp. MBLA0147 TaxID=3079934 RepID=UPI003524AC9F